MKKTSKILAILLTIAMVLTLVPTAAFAADPVEATLTFDDTAKRTEFSTERQVWEENGVQVVNEKGSSTSNIADYANPVRFYKNSTVMISCAGGNISKIVFTCGSPSYASALATAIGADAVTDGTAVTYTLAEALETVTVILSGGQVRVSSLVVTYVAGAETDPTEEPTEEPTEAPTEEPTEEPTEAPTEEPTEAPTEEPTEAPAVEPLKDFEIAAEWIWGSTIADAGVDGAEKIVSRCAEMGITDLYLLVKGTGGGLSWLNTEFPEYLSRTDRDVMQETIDACRAHGLRIHAWICNGQDSNYKADHPEAGQWHYVRERDNDNIALYNEGYVEYMKKIVAEIAAYDVDGIHLDYIRYNHLANGWSETDLANMEAMGGNIDNIKYIINKTFYSQFLPEGESVDANYAFDQYNAGNPDAVIIAQYRRNVVSNYAKAIIEAAKAVNPNLIITAALQPETAYDHAFGGLHYGNNFADCPELYDYIVPMAYSNVFGQDAAWMVKVAAASIDQGNPVVMGLNSYYGNNGVTSKLLMADIEAVRGMLDDEAYAKNVLGICHFRNTQFGYAKVSYNLNEKNMVVKTINANPAYTYNWVQIELQEGLVAKAGTVVDGYINDTKVEIAEDGSYIRFYGTDILLGDAEGTLALTYEGDLDVSKPAALVRIYLTNESRAYNIYVDATNETTVKNGVVAENGGLFYYVDGVMQTGLGLIELNGGYYYVRTNGELAIGEYWVSNPNGLVEPFLYEFGVDGKMIDPPIVDGELKNGIVAENNALYYYVNGLVQYGAGLVEVEGKYYYVRSNGQAVTGEYYVTNANGLVKEGFYTFRADGSMIVDANGIVEVDGVLYYYENGVVAYGAGLVEVDGAYYYVRSNGTCAIGEYYVTNTNDLMPEGFYTFGEDGKMVL